MILAFWLWACSNEEAAPPAEAPIADATPDPTKSSVEAEEAEPEAKGTEAPRVPATSASRLAASHVLVAWAGAMKPDASVKRTRDEARVRADEARARILAGEDFAKVATAMSDDKSKSRGGRLGNFNAGTMVPVFEEVVRGLSVGEVSTVVESPFGFHVIRREMMSQIHCAQVIVGYGGAERPIEGVTRSKEEARGRIEAALAELQGGADWNATVRKYSDGPAKEDNGDLGWFSRRQLMPQLDEPAFDLDIGAITTIIETPTGFHLVKRLE